MKANANSTVAQATCRNRLLNWVLTLCLIGATLVPATAKAAQADAEVPFTQALADAHQVTSLNSGWTVYVSHGESMLPQIDHNSLLLVDKASFDKLAVGMLVVYRDASGDLVSHRLIQCTSAGWVAKGLNNTQEDPSLVTRDNLQGVVFGVMHYQAGTETLAAMNTAQQPAVAFAKKY